MPGVLYGVNYQTGRQENGNPLGYGLFQIYAEHNIERSGFYPRASFSRPRRIFVAGSAWRKRYLGESIRMSPKIRRLYKFVNGNFS